MNKKIREDKIQTGLRVPEHQYKRLDVMSQRMGVSINALILILIDMGLSHFEFQSKELPH